MFKTHLSKSIFSYDSLFIIFTLTCLPTRAHYPCDLCDESSIDDMKRAIRPKLMLMPMAKAKVSVS